VRYAPAIHRPALAVDRARYASEPVVIVLAESLSQAEDATEAVDIDWEPIAAVTDIERRSRPKPAPIPRDWHQPCDGLRDWSGPIRSRAPTWW